MSAEDLKNKGNAALTAGNLDEAIQFYNEAIKINPVKEYYGNRSLAYSKQGKYNEALDDAEKCVQADPNWSKGYLRKGVAFQSLRKYKEAAAAYKKGLELEPNNAQMKQGFTEVENLAKWEETQMKKEEAAKDQLAQIYKIFEGDPLGQCRLMPEVKHLVDDVGFVKKISEIQQDPKKLQQYRADEQIMQFISYATQYQHLSKLTDKERAELYQKQEETRMRMEKMEDEERDRRRKEEAARKQEEERKRKAEEEAKMAPEQRKALQLKEEGNNFYKKKDYKQALDLYQQAHQLDPQNIVYLNNIAAVHLELKEFDKCIEVSTHAVDVGRTHRASFETIARALQRLGNAYFKKEDYAHAIENYKSSLTEYRDKDTLNMLHKAEKLLEEKQKKAYINPELSVKAKDEGNEFFKNQKFPEAVERYTEAIKRDPDNHVLYTNRATAYTKLGAFSEALKDCDTCLNLCPSFIKAYLKKGNIYFVTKQYQKCMDVYEQALNYDPENAEIKEAMNKTFMQLNKGTDVDAVKRNLESNPELQTILQDPMTQEVLKTIKNGQSIDHYLKDPKIASNIEKLILAGVIGSAPGGSRKH